jgi:hypothetical protein
MSRGDDFQKQVQDNINRVNDEMMQNLRQHRQQAHDMNLQAQQQRFEARQNYLNMSQAERQHGEQIAELKRHNDRLDKVERDRKKDNKWTWVKFAISTIIALGALVVAIISLAVN